MPTIMLATDLSPHGDRALDRAALLAAVRDDTLAVVNVVGQELRTGDSVPVAEAVALAALRRHIDEAELPATLRVTPQVLTGEPEDTLAEAAGAAGAALLVLGGAHADLLERLFRRSVIHQAVRQSPCPVLVVHRRAKRPYRRVLVATDLSLPARRALEFALHLLPGCEITLLHAALSDAPPLGADDPKLRLDDLITATVARLAMDGVAPPASVTALVEVGSARNVVPAAAARLNAELVVVGTLGLSGAVGILLGGTAEALIDSLDCDVLAVKA